MYDAFYTYYSKPRYGFYLQVIDQKIDCFHYTVSLGGHEVSSVYTTANFSIIVLPDKLIRIGRIVKAFYKTEYPVYDIQNEIQIGSFDFTRSSWSKRTSCFFEIGTGPSCTFEEARVARNFFEPFRWDGYVFDLNDADNRCWQYRGNREMGDIEFVGAKPDDLLLSCGIFALDEKFRLAKEDDR